MQSIIQSYKTQLSLDNESKANEFFFFFFFPFHFGDFSDFLNWMSIKEYLQYFLCNKKNLYIQCMLHIC